MSIQNSEQVNKGTEVAANTIAVGAKGAKKTGEKAAKAGVKVWHILPLKVKVILVIFLLFLIIASVLIEGVTSSSFKRVFRTNAIHEDNSFNDPKTNKEAEESIYKKDIAIEDTAKLVKVIHAAKQKDYESISKSVEREIKRKAAQNVKSGLDEVDVDLSIQKAKRELSESSSYSYVTSDLSSTDMSGSDAAEAFGKKIVEDAKSYIGKLQYKKGGKSLKTGADCSGFVIAIMGKNGISLKPRESDWLAKSDSIDIDDPGKWKPGDVIDYPHHSAIYIGDGKIVHAANPKDDVCISSYKLGMKVIHVYRFRPPDSFTASFAASNKTSTGGFDGKSKNGKCRIGQAAGGEHGFSYQKAGDQTGGEVALANWSSRFTHVARFKDPSKALRAAKIMYDSCKNPNIGYDNANKKEAQSYFKALKKAKGDATKIDEPCETACSQMCAAIVYVTGVEIKTYVDTKGIYRELKEKPNDFEILTGSKYTDSPKNLQPGDILMDLSGERHTAMVVQTKNGLAGVTLAGGTSTAFTKKSEYTELGVINSSTGKRYDIGYIGSSNCAQSFAYVNGMFAVSLVTSSSSPSCVGLYDKQGKRIAKVKANVISHANGACCSEDGQYLVTGTLNGSSSSGVHAFKVGTRKLSYDSVKSMPIYSSSIAYDRTTHNYILGAGGSLDVYDSAYSHVTTISRNIHGKYYQDIGAGDGFIFACHTKKKGYDNSGLNYVDIYEESTGDYCGSYKVPYGELESAEVVDGELVLLVHILGRKNYIQYTGIRVDGSAASAGPFSSANITKLDMDILAAYNISISNTAMYMNPKNIREGDMEGWMDSSAYTDASGNKLKLYWWGENRGLINYEKDLDSKVDALIKGDARKDISKHFFKITIGTSPETVSTTDEDGNPVEKKIVPVTIKEAEVENIMEPMFGVDPEDYYINGKTTKTARKDRKKKAGEEPDINDSTLLKLPEGTANNLTAAYSLSDITGRLLFGDLQYVQNPGFDENMPGAAGSPASAIGLVKVGSKEQQQIINYILKTWPPGSNPYNAGYAHKCEKWVCDMYKGAGISSHGSCCASCSRDKQATTKGDIPPGAMIYSSPAKYKSGVHCSACGRNAGHVAIYLGNNKVAGSQPEYIMSLDKWISWFGYGGWGFSGNSFNYQ